MNIKNYDDPFATAADDDTASNDNFEVMEDELRGMLTRLELLEETQADDEDVIELRENIQEKIEELSEFGTLSTDIIEQLKTLDFDLGDEEPEDEI